MARRSIGSNGPSTSGLLKFAVSDAKRIAVALEHRRCGFEVVQPTNTTDPREIERTIIAVTEACSADDTLVIFFSGHGILEGGGLLLVLDETDRDRPLATALHADTLVKAMRYCRARHKLLILDCCHAGGVFLQNGFKDQADAKMDAVIVGSDKAESFVALMASDRLQRARELDDIGGSFLTSAITEALGDRLSEADYDRDNAIDLNDLMRWLANRASAHNKTYPKKQVPIPFVFGRERGRIYLTIEPTAWLVHEIGPIAGHTFVVLPAQAERKRAWLIGKTPVTNSQYQQFVSVTGWPEPSGQSFVAGNKRKFWRSGFQPWKDEKFGAAEMPVVCVAFEDALRFFDWLSDEITHFEVQLVPTRVWDYAAFGNEYPSFDRQRWLTGNIHDKKDVPAEVSNACDRANCFGAIDLFGNVWEWTSGGHERIGIVAASNWIMRNQQLRGGRYLDDLSKTSPILTAAALPDGIETRHFDLGFRIAGKTALKNLPKDVATRVADCPRIQPDSDNVSITA